MEGGVSPVVFTKEVYIGTVPVNREEMKSCIAGMYNQPYTASSPVEAINSSVHNQLTLADVVAAVTAEQTIVNPTAPSEATLSGDECISSAPSAPMWRTLNKGWMKINCIKY